MPLQNPRFVPYFSLLVTHSYTPEGENQRFLRQVRTKILSLVDTCRKDGNFVLLTYVNECLRNQSIGRISDFFCKGIQLYIEFT